MVDGEDFSDLQNLFTLFNGDWRFFDFSNGNFQSEFDSIIQLTSVKITDEIVRRTIFGYGEF